MNNVLISGASGFLGSYIKKAWLSRGVLITTIGIDNTAEVNCDLSNTVPIFCDNYKYVVHAAGKAHFIPKTSQEEQAFFDVNLDGTKNFLKGIEKLDKLPIALCFISSVSVYGLEMGLNIKENNPKHPKGASAKSKFLAEEYILSWGKRNSVIITILRLPLVIGKNAPGNLEVLINGIKSDRYANIAGGKAKRSMVLAEDLANFIPEIIDKGGVYNLTDAYNPSFYEISDTISSHFKCKSPLNIPSTIAKLLAMFGDVFQYIFSLTLPFNSNQLSKMTKDLTFDDSAAR